MGKGEPKGELASLFELVVGNWIANGSFHSYRHRQCCCVDQYESERLQYAADKAWQADNPDYPAAWHSTPLPEADGRKPFRYPMHGSEY